MKRTLICALVLACLGRLAVAAELQYDYSNDSFFDPNTGLYWQYAPMPASSWQPTSPWIVATAGQVTTLLGEMSAEPSANPAPYNYSLAQFVSFIDSDMPAPVNPSPTFSGWLRPPRLPYVYYPLSQECAPDCFIGLYLQYEQSTQGWTWVGPGPTTANYGPNIGDYLDPGSPVVYSLQVTTTPPVPLPATVWLLVSGLMGVMGLGRRTRAYIV